MNEFNKEVQSAATNAFDIAFPESKRLDIIYASSHSILTYVHKQLDSSAASLSDLKYVSVEEADERYERVIVTALHALGDLMIRIDTNKNKALDYSLCLAACLKLLKSHVSVKIKRECVSTLSRAVTYLPFIIEKDINKYAKLVFNMLTSTEDAAGLSLAYQTMIVFVRIFPVVTWEHVSFKKVLAPPLLAHLKNAFSNAGGSGASCYTCIFPLLHVLYNCDAVKEDVIDLLPSLFENMWKVCL